MAIYPIRKIGDPVLRTKAKEVKEITNKTRKLIDSMFETMYDAPGIGLAAPQIGISKRIIVIDLDDNPIALINPVIVEKQGSQVGEEGCLSIPGERALVERYQFVKVRGLDINGREIEIESEDLLARALQHEIDHLDGILFIDKIYKE
ncbi:peptide deformylase [Anoxybacter fermentans]|uniref:Peptide deformylase n=1 Tax=Anoxybacter fermentans TaxID=1323375 RepID=A0A3S9SX91_9FIRM|nr:peptide deformylase [Anoxybacter fermentans]AZR72966.1 peptide deformylase [Anoxybacter fermentans]